MTEVGNEHQGRRLQLPRTKGWKQKRRKEKKKGKRKAKDSGEGYPMTELIPKADDVL